VINASQTSAWLGDQSCIWKQHGVWGLKDNNKPVLLKSDYFAKDPATGEKVDFYKNFYVPFVNKYARTIQSVNSSLYCFVEPLANEASRTSWLAGLLANFSLLIEIPSVWKG
jgi:hypothetical protein